MCMWTMGIELGSSGRVGFVLHHWAIPSCEVDGTRAYVVKWKEPDAEGQIPSIPSHRQEQISHGFKGSTIISQKIQERCKNSVSSWSSEAFLIRASGIMGIPMESNFKSLFWEANLHFLLIYSRYGHAVLKTLHQSPSTCCELRWSHLQRVQACSQEIAAKPMLSSALLSTSEPPYGCGTWL